MPRLDRGLVEHKLPTTKGATLVKQAPRRLVTVVTEVVHGEVKKLLNAGYVRIAKYVD